MVSSFIKTILLTLLVLASGLVLSALYDLLRQFYGPIHIAIGAATIIIAIVATKPIKLKDFLGQ